MKKMLSIALLVSSSFSTYSFALETLNDEQLANKTGQDGLSVSIKGDGLTGIDSLRIIDGDGFTTGTISQTKQAGISTNFSSAVRACETASKDCAPVTAPLQIVIDTDAGNNNGAFVNVAITGAAKAFYVPISSISLVSGDNVKGNWSKETDIVEFKDSAGNDGGIAINMKNAITANIQLGNQPQGNMVLVNANELDIDLGTLNILSYDTNSVRASQLSTNIKVTDFNFKGVGIDIDANDGVVANFVGDTTIGSVNIDNTVMGTVGSSDTKVFDGLKNGSIGNISMSNISIKNLKVGVKGL